jgi:hypothetical protein
MTRSILAMLLLATVSMLPGDCSDGLDPDDVEETPRPKAGPGRVTGGAGPDVGVPGPLTAEVPAEWADQATALGGAAGADAAVSAFIAAGSEACPVLRGIVLDDGDLSRRGRAIQALTGIDDICSEDALLELHRVRSLPDLIRTWAAAGRVAQAKTMDDLIPLAGLVAEFPALQRPVGMRAEALLDDDVAAGHLIALSIDAPAMSGSVLALLRARPISEITAVMLEDARDPIRRQAAAVLGGLVNGNPDAAGKVIDAYRFTPGALRTSWQGGALYVPAARWDKAQAKALYRNLLSWQIFCEEEGLDGEKRQIGNNLRSVGIWRVAGYRRYNQDTFAAAKAYGQDEGPAALRELLKAHGLEGDARYGGRRQVTR